MDRRTFLSGAGAATLGSISLTASQAPAQSGPRVRRNVQMLGNNDPFFSDYARAVEAMHRVSQTDRKEAKSWRNHALTHLEHCPHGREDFFHWHRHYITYFERLCGSLIGKPDFALAYWDWSEKDGRIPDLFYDMDFLNVAHWRDPSNASSPNWDGGEEVRTIGVRGLPKGRGAQRGLPNGGPFARAALQNILRFSSFTNFITGIERGAHGAGHTIIGDLPREPNGHMSAGMSPLDPIFWLHHCNVDRLWEEWRNRPGHSTPAMNYTYTLQFVRMNGQLVTRTAQQALDIREQGFTYDTLQAIASAPASAARTAAASEGPSPAVPAISGRTAQVVTAVVGGSGVVSVPLRTSAPAAGAGQGASPAGRTTAPSGAGAARGAAPAAAAGRLLLKLDGVQIDKDPGRVLVNVFVDGGGTSAAGAGPLSDKNYAGTFAFFGSNHGGDHAGHGSAPGRAAAPTMRNTVVIDITDTVAVLSAGGQFNADQLTVQFRPVTGAEGGTSAAKVSVGSFEVVRG
jgi:tyrosinase